MTEYFYKVHWLDGKIEIIKGTTFVNALIKAGYDKGAVNMIDYYRQITTNEALNFKQEKCGNTENALRNYAKELNEHAKDGMVSTYWINVILETTIAELEEKK